MLSRLPFDSSRTVSVEIYKRYIYSVGRGTIEGDNASANIHVDAKENSAFTCRLPIKGLRINRVSNRYRLLEQQPVGHEVSTRVNHTTAAALFRDYRYESWTRRDPTKRPFPSLFLSLTRTRSSHRPSRLHPSNDPWINTLSSLRYFLNIEQKDIYLRANSFHDRSDRSIDRTIRSKKI